MQRLKALTPSNRNGYKVSRKRYRPNGTVGKVAHGIATAKSVAGNDAIVGDTDGDTRCSRYRLNVDSGNDGDGDGRYPSNRDKLCLLLHYLRSKQQPVLIMLCARARLLSLDITSPCRAIQLSYQARLNGGRQRDDRISYPSRRVSQNSRFYEIATRSFVITRTRGSLYTLMM